MHMELFMFIIRCYFDSGQKLSLPLFLVSLRVEKHGHGRKKKVIVKDRTRKHELKKDKTENREHIGITCL